MSCVLVHNDKLATANAMKLFGISPFEYSWPHSDQTQRQGLRLAALSEIVIEMILLLELFVVAHDVGVVVELVAEAEARC